MDPRHKVVGQLETGPLPCSIIGRAALDVAGETACPPIGHLQRRPHRTSEPDGCEFGEMMTINALEHYGTAGRAFLEALMVHFDVYLKIVQDHMRIFLDYPCSIDGNTW
jgi:hypothetical protein